MMTVHKVSEITGASIRTLHHYDKIGLLPAAAVTQAGYRLYNEKSLERLQQIKLLKIRRKHLDNLIALAHEIKNEGADKMSFKEFDKSEIEKYSAEAKEKWGNTDAWREYEKKSGGRCVSEQDNINAQLMDIFREFGTIRNGSPESGEAEALVKKLQCFITENYYTCTDEILLSLGTMYAAGGDFTRNIDRAGGEGTALFACRAIESAVK